jgi:hypothetical protein
MMATTIKEKEWDFIMRPIQEAGLLKVELSRKFPNKVLYGPKIYQGLGIMHPYFNQELSHIATCIHKGEHQIITGELIRALLEQLQVKIGLPGYLLQHDYLIGQSLDTDCWMKTVWSFAREHEIGIHDTLPKLELNRWNDSYLMEEFVRNRFVGHELKKLNEC